MSLRGQFQSYEKAEPPELDANDTIDVDQSLLDEDAVFAALDVHKTTRDSLVGMASSIGVGFAFYLVFDAFAGVFMFVFAGVIAIAMVKIRQSGTATEELDRLRKLKLPFALRQYVELLARQNGEGRPQLAIWFEQPVPEAERELWEQRAMKAGAVEALWFQEGRQLRLNAAPMRLAVDEVERTRHGRRLTGNIVPYNVPLHRYVRRMLLEVAAPLREGTPLRAMRANVA